MSTQYCSSGNMRKNFMVTLHKKIKKYEYLYEYKKDFYTKITLDKGTDKFMDKSLECWLIFLELKL
jgi:hypothetical protein